MTIPDQFKTQAVDLQTAFFKLPADTFEEVLERWQIAKMQQAQWAQAEKDLRLALFGAGVPNPKEGVNNVPLNDGRIVKFTHKLNRTVKDPETALSTLQGLGVNDTTAYLKPKYDLVLSGYKAAPENVRAVLDQHVTTTPGLPALEVK